MEGKCINWSSQDYISGDIEITEDLTDDLTDIIKDLKFYKSMFVTHNNSCLFNLRIKTKDGVKVWIDPTRDTHAYISTLDKDSEVEEWLKPTRCSR